MHLCFIVSIIRNKHELFIDKMIKYLGFAQNNQGQERTGDIDEIKFTKSCFVWDLGSLLYCSIFVHVKFSIIKSYNTFSYVNTDF